MYYVSGNCVSPDKSNPVEYWFALIIYVHYESQISQYIVFDVLFVAEIDNAPVRSALLAAPSVMGERYVVGVLSKFVYLSRGLSGVWTIVSICLFTWLGAYFSHFKGERRSWQDHFQSLISRVWWLSYIVLARLPSLLSFTLNEPKFLILSTDSIHCSYGMLFTNPSYLPVLLLLQTHTQWYSGISY